MRKFPVANKGFFEKAKRALKLNMLKAIFISLKPIKKTNKMNRILAVLILLLSLSCKSKAQKVDVNNAITITNNELKDIVSYLASDNLGGRDTGSNGIDNAATYIEDYFKTQNIKPYFETYRDAFKVDSLDAFNVVGFIEGHDKNLKDEIIIVGAHYDHIGIRQIIENDSIANGANDNATGTSAVMTIAKYFSAKKSNKRSLMFVLFSAEERGLLGSKHLAKKLKDKSVDIYTVVNFEMLGLPIEGLDFTAYVTGYNTSNMAQFINEKVNDSSFIGLYELSQKYNLFKRSDNYPFYLEYNIPSQSISTSHNYEHYHKVGDEADLMDYDHMANFINTLIPAIESMANTPTKVIKLNE